MNKVILIGGNHHNGLGLVRNFGVNKIRPYGIIIGGINECFVTKSKYWEKTWILSNENEAIKFLIDHFKNEVEKPVIIPWSDSAAAAIDNNLDALKPYFILPSLGGMQGAIVKMMDKQRQIEFINKYGLPMAKSWTVRLPYERGSCEFIFPCICKPVSSYEGLKTDIRKCENLNELLLYFEEIRSKGYKRILVQEFINYDKELEFVGSCDDNPSYIISHNVRNWPVVGGTNSFLQIIADKDVKCVCEKLLKALKCENYSGMFDIELFQVKNRILVNEINWRNTGNSFFSLGTGVHYAVIWYLNAIGIDTSNMKRYTEDTSQYAMNEATDLRHVVFGKLKLVEWFSDLQKTKSFALWYVKDLKPSLYQYIYLLKELLLHRCNG